MCVRFDFPYSNELTKKTYGFASVLQNIQPNVLFVYHLLCEAIELSSKLLVQLSANVFAFASTRVCFSCRLCHCTVSSAMPISWHRAGSDADSGKDFIWPLLVWCAFLAGAYAHSLTFYAACQRMCVGVAIRCSGDGGQQVPGGGGAGGRRAQELCLHLPALPPEC